MQATYKCKCRSVARRLFNLLMLSGFTRLPLASLKCNSVQAAQLLKHVM